MKFITCVKQVPDTKEVEIDEETGTIVREGVPSILNPFDEFALNLAVEAKEKLNKEVEIVALSMGPPQAEEALKKCLAIGADKGILLTDKSFAGADTWATSLTLARAIEKIDDVKIVFCGQEATDGSTGQVGPELAALLSLPQITYVEEVSRIEKEGDHIVCKKEVDDGYLKVKSKLPALLTCLTPPDFEPRIPNIKDIMKAKKKPLEKWRIERIGEPPENVGLKGSRSRVVNIYPPKREKKGKKIQKPPEEAIKHIMDFIGEISQ